MKNVEPFKYLGIHLSSDDSLDGKIAARLAKASSSFGRLWTRVWRERGISSNTKLAVYRAVVLTSLLYGCETWTTYRKHIKRLDQFHLRCLRRILAIHWQDRVTNQEVLRRAGLPGVEALIMQARLRWTGHIMRQDDSRLPKKIFCGELSHGTRRQCGQRKRFKDCLRDSLQNCKIPQDGWEARTADRSVWRHHILRGVKNFEANRLARLDKKRQARKDRPEGPTAAAVTCPTCGRRCASQFGLQSHMKSHQRRR